MGQEPLLGANTLEGLLLTLNPVNGRLVHTLRPGDDFCMQWTARTGQGLERRGLAM